MAQHENPQRPPEPYYPAGKPKHIKGGKGPDQAETVADKEDLGDVIRAIGDMAGELHEVFFAVPDVADDTGRVDPESFEAAIRHAFLSAGNALDYAIRLVAEKGRAARIKKLRRELAEEMRAAGMTGDPDGESPLPPPNTSVG